MKTMCAVAAMLLLHGAHASALSISGPVSGAPGVTFAYDDNQSSFALVFRGGPIEQGTWIDEFWRLEPLVPAGAEASWDISIANIFGYEVFIPGVTQGDVVEFFEPRLGHLRPPHGEGAQTVRACDYFDCRDFGGGGLPPGTPGLIIDLLTPSLGRPSLLNGHFSVGHGAHQDVYSWAASFSGTSEDIIDWTVRIEGVHIPEPGSGLLVTLGLLAGCGRRRVRLSRQRRS